MEEQLTATAILPNPQASAAAQEQEHAAMNDLHNINAVEDDDAVEVRENRENQIVVINATLTRIERWFGEIKFTALPDGQVVMLFPSGLTLREDGKRLRLLD